MKEDYIEKDHPKISKQKTKYFVDFMQYFLNKENIIIK